MFTLFDEMKAAGILRLVLLLSAAFLASTVFADTIPTSAVRPNVVFILADDLGQRDIAAFNPATFYETPNVDRIAREGMRFNNAYSACNVCSPTRYSIMTGRYPVRSGITNFLAGDRSGRFEPAPLELFMPLSEETLGEAFQTAGYRTAFLGKWHMGNMSEYGPDKQGFEVVSGDMQYVAPARTEISLKSRGAMSKGASFIEGMPKDAPIIEWKTDKITEDALVILDAWKSQPFLMYFSMYQVHVPLGASPDVVKKYQEKVAQTGRHAEWTDFIAEEQVLSVDAPRQTRVVQNHPIYAGMVEKMDDCVGRILAKLDSLGIADNTIIVFMSDNGGLSTAEGSPTSNLPYRTGKGWNYEGGLRTPMIIKWAGSTKPNTVCDVPVISTDFYPTLLDMAALPPKPQQHIDGVSLVPLLRGKSALERDAIFWHYPHYSNQGGFPSSAVRMGDYKLIQRIEDGRSHLYHLRSDIGEQVDLAQTDPERVKVMQARLFAWYTETGAKFLRPKDGANPWNPQ